jgi:hypothetical protein
MAVHIIIDGYNLIRQSAELSPLDRIDLQQGREALLELLAAYKKIKRHHITVVFDGTDAYSLYRQRDQVKGIKVLFPVGAKLPIRLSNAWPQMKGKGRWWLVPTGMWLHMQRLKKRLP